MVSLQITKVVCWNYFILAQDNKLCAYLPTIQLEIGYGLVIYTMELANTINQVVVFFFFPENWFTSTSLDQKNIKKITTVIITILYQ